LQGPFAVSVIGNYHVVNIACQVISEDNIFSIAEVYIACKWGNTNKGDEESSLQKMGDREAII